MATMKSGALSMSLSKWLSKANAIDATEIVMARCMIEFLTLKQHSLSRYRPEKINRGMKHSITLTLLSLTSQPALYSWQI